MAEITKEFEVELKDGRTVNVTVTVEGSHDPDYGADADGNRGVSMWFIEGHSYEADEELNSADKVEVDALVDSLVDDEEWDFDSADEEHDREWYEVD